MRISDVRFQPQAHDWLQRTLRSGRMPHAALFAGPEGIGKDLFAARMAALLLCESPRDVPAPKDAGSPVSPWKEACGKCVECTLMQAGNHPDFHRIHRGLTRHHPEKRVRDKKATELGVDVIRHFLLGEIGHRPSRGRAKMFIVAEAERLNEESQNALLKTLEEPPGHSYLILLTPTPEILLPTTRSRCQTVVFRALPKAFVVEQLQSRTQVPAAGANYLAELSQGRLGVALQWAELGLFEHAPTIVALAGRAADDALGAASGLKSLADELAKASKKAVPAEVEDDDEDTDGDEAAPATGKQALDTNLARQSQSTVLAMMSLLLRDVLRVRAGQMPLAYPREPAVQRLAASTAPELLAQAIRSVADAESQIRSNVNVALMFDAVGIALSRALAGQMAGV